MPVLQKRPWSTKLRKDTRHNDSIATSLTRSLPIDRPTDRPTKPRDLAGKGHRRWRRTGYTVSGARLHKTPRRKFPADVFSTTGESVNKRRAMRLWKDKSTRSHDNNTQGSTTPSNWYILDNGKSVKAERRVYGKIIRQDRTVITRNNTQGYSDPSDEIFQLMSCRLRGEFKRRAMRL